MQPLMIHESREQLLDEVKALMYVALKTGRSLIIPNILVGKSFIFSLSIFSSNSFCPFRRVGFGSAWGAEERAETL